MMLDMFTMSAVNITVTGVLGLVLVFLWARDRSSAFVGWWGLAQLVQCAGIVIAFAATLANDIHLVVFGAASMIFGDTLKWKAARLFEHRDIHPFVLLAGPVAFLFAARSGYFPTFDDRLILTCTVMASYNLAAAVELTRGRHEPLKSRWPAVFLLVVTGLGYLSWLPLIAAMPIRHAALVFVSSWFPGVVLVTLLGRVALSFMVLAMAKERQELRQRMSALTDALTGLPNRRALFEAVDLLRDDGERLAQHPVSVLLFDLDHFKRINDNFGHEEGDSVLKLFASTLTHTLDEDCIVARVGGEEFAAILPHTDPAAVLETAEQVRSVFAGRAAVVNGRPIGATVSAGAASNGNLDCDLGALFRRADAALYAAKRAGRNRVEFLHHDDPAPFETPWPTVRAGRKGPTAAEPVIEHPAA